MNELNNRWFGSRPIYAELSPVTDFREACCRQYEVGECTRSGFCNFMHLKPISRELRRYLYSRRRGMGIGGGRGSQTPSPPPRPKEGGGGGGGRRRRSRSRSPRGERGGRGRGRDRDRSRDRMPRH